MMAASSSSKTGQMEESTFCLRVSKEQFENDTQSETDKALGELCLYLERNPEVYSKVLRKKKQDELERSGVVSFVKSKVSHLIHGEKYSQSLISQAECERQTHELTAGMCKAFQQSQEIKGAVTRQTTRIAEKRKAQLNKSQNMNGSTFSTLNKSILNTTSGPSTSQSLINEFTSMDECNMSTSKSRKRLSDNGDSSFHEEGDVGSKRRKINADSSVIQSGTDSGDDIDTENAEIKMSQVEASALQGKEKEDEKSAEDKGKPPKLQQPPTTASPVTYENAHSEADTEVFEDAENGETVSTSNLDISEALPPPIITVTSPTPQFFTPPTSPDPTSMSSVPEPHLLSLSTLFVKSSTELSQSGDANSSAITDDVASSIKTGDETLSVSTNITKVLCPSEIVTDNISAPAVLQISENKVINTGSPKTRVTKGRRRMQRNLSGENNQ